MANLLTELRLKFPKDAEFLKASAAAQTLLGNGFSEDYVIGLLTAKVQGVQKGKKDPQGHDRGDDMEEGGQETNPNGDRENTDDSTNSAKKPKKPKKSKKNPDPGYSPDEPDDEDTSTWKPKKGDSDGDADDADEEEEAARADKAGGELTDDEEYRLRDPKDRKRHQKKSEEDGDYEEGEEVEEETSDEDAAAKPKKRKTKKNPDPGFSPDGEPDDHDESTWEPSDISAEPDKEPTKGGDKEAKPDDEDDLEDEECDDEMSAKKPKRKKGISFDDKVSFDLVLRKGGCGFDYNPITDMFAVRFGLGETYGRSASCAPILDTFGDKPDQVVPAMKRLFEEPTFVEVMKGAGLDPLQMSSNADNDFRPTDEEYKQIYPMMKRKFKPEQLKVFYTLSADSLDDRQSERFSHMGHKDMAKLSIAQPVMQDHDYTRSAGVFGKIFWAKAVKDGAGNSYFVQKFYMPDTPENKSIIDGFESGVNDKLSVGIAMKRADYLCNECQKPMFGKSMDMGSWCGHMPGQELPNGKVATATINRVSDFRELSRVTVPAQRNAAVKSLFAVDGSEIAGVLTASDETKAKLAAFAEGPQFEKAIEHAKSVLKKPVARLPQNPNVNGEDEEAMNESIEKFLEAQNGLIKSQNETNQLLRTLVNAMKTASNDREAEQQLVEDKQKLLEKTIKETREVVKILLDTQIEFQKQCGVVVNKSLHKVAREISATVHMGQSRIEAEKEAKGDDHYYEQFQDRFVDG